jgi:GntR family transcriptional repressor for pyruvate dehydrogenase complex
MARKHRDVMRVLLAEIASGARSVGEMLPREVDLAAEFDVSRGVARETIRALEERGVISVRHGKGATITEPAAWDVFDPDVLAAILDSDRGRDVMAEYLECRRILEVEAAGLAAERALPRDVEQLAEAMRRMEDAAALPPSQAAEERFDEAAMEFHRALAAIGNRALGGLVQRVQSPLQLVLLALTGRDYRRDRALREHRRIVTAVAAGDSAEARRAMSDHLDAVAAYLDVDRRRR